MYARLLTIMLSLGFIGIGPQVAIGQPAIKGDSPDNLPKGIVQVWTEAGAQVGWMYLEDGPFPYFSTDKREYNKPIPAFKFSSFKKSVLAKLPDPGVPFGLGLNSTEITDIDLKELSKLTSLKGLCIAKGSWESACVRTPAGSGRLMVTQPGGDSTMPKRSELTVEQRREAVLALLRREEPAAQAGRGVMGISF